MHRPELLVGHTGREIAHVAPDAGGLKHRRVFLAAARAHGVVDGVVGVAERGQAVDNAGQRVGPLNARAEADGLEIGLRGGAERGNRGLAQRISETHALEGVPLERIAEREVQAGGGLVVVLRQRLLRLGQVRRLAGLGLVVLGRVEVLFVVENLEAHIERAVADIRLREAEDKLAADAAQVALQAERFAQAEEVIGLVVDAQKRAGLAAHAAIQPDRVLALLFHLQQQVHRARLGVLVGLRVLIHLEGFKVLQLVQPHQAVLPQLRVVDLAFLQHQFAANDLVAGDGVALELDARDVKWLALVDVDDQRDGLLLVVEDGLGDGAEVDVSQLAVGLLEVLQALADQRGVEPVAVLAPQRWRAVPSHW